MNTFSHILISDFLHKYFIEQSGIELNWASFMIGNMLPDFKPAFKRLPHEPKSWEQYLKNEFGALSDNKQEGIRFDRDLSRRLGIICHFYADFFCFAHTEAFDGSTYQHMKYEWMLDRFTRRYYPALFWTDFAGGMKPDRSAGRIYDGFAALHQEYLKQEQTFENDIVYTLRACIDTISLIIGHVASKEPELGELLPEAI